MTSLTPMLNSKILAQSEEPKRSPGENLRCTFEGALQLIHLHGVNINVEASKNKSKTSTKLHVGNISPTCANKELWAKFGEYGPVIECDIMKDYAFVHMERAEDAVEALRGLDNREFQEDITSHSLTQNRFYNFLALWTSNF
ncbi:hypothetical protein GH733_012100 [Mirounga leonina]|nr:hypothetical protein GH733_012100 [Mirounga leonina]